MPLEPERRAELQAIKLRALVTEAGHDLGQTQPETLGQGSALVLDGCCWLLADTERPEISLGQGILLAASRSLSQLHVLFDDPQSAAKAACQAQGLNPSPTISLITERTLAPATPEPTEPAVTPPPCPEDFANLCSGAGVETVVEHGMWRGEILGLEVARLVDGITEVGVGRFDREASALLHSDQPTSEALAAAADQVRSQRHPGAGAHPLATLVRERWLRHTLLADPSLVGLNDLVAIDPATERTNLRDPAPAFAWGTDPAGQNVLVACSTGVDVNLTPQTAELIVRHQPDQVIVVVPPRDQLPVVEKSIQLLAAPTNLVPLQGPWT